MSSYSHRLLFVLRFVKNITWYYPYEKSLNLRFFKHCRAFIKILGWDEVYFKKGGSFHALPSYYTIFFTKLYGLQCCIRHTQIFDMPPNFFLESTDIKKSADCITVVNVMQTDSSTDIYSRCYAWFHFHPETTKCHRLSR